MILFEKITERNRKGKRRCSRSYIYCRSVAFPIQEQIAPQSDSRAAARMIRLSQRRLTTAIPPKPSATPFAARMTRLSQRRLKQIRSLAHRKYRDRYGETIVEGARAVEAALAAGAELRALLVAESAQERFAQRFSVPADRVHVVSGREMRAVSALETSPGVLGVAGIRRQAPEALASMQRILLLDGVSDPGNAGTIIRTAAWFGVEAVVAAPDSADAYHPKVVRASMGGVWDVGQVETPDPAGMLAELAARGFAVYGADLQGTPVDAWAPALPSVLALGSEAHGISRNVRERITERVLVPGRTRKAGEPGPKSVESLNAAVAAGILMHAWARKA